MAMPAESFDGFHVWTFADRIRKARRDPLGDRERLTQEAMADAVGVPVKRYSNWEAGYAQPKGRDMVDVARAVSEATGYPVSWLLGLSTSGYDLDSAAFALITNPDPVMQQTLPFPPDLVVADHRT